MAGTCRTLDFTRSERRGFKYLGVFNRLVLYLSILDGPRLGRQLVDDLLRGWGADSDHLASAHAVVDAVARRHPLARPLPDGDDQ